MALPRLFGPFQHVHEHNTYDRIRLWYRSALGQKIFREEKSVLDQVLPKLFGYHLLQMGVANSSVLCESSPIKHKFHVSEYSCGDFPKNVSVVNCQVGNLAIDSDSIDVALLHHSLDFHNNPQRVLREVARTLMPGGKIVIVGFNPWSWWGLARLFLKGAGRGPWQGNFLSPYRLSDWLNLLDFEIEGCECVCYGLPTVNKKASSVFSVISGLTKRWLSQTGAVYTFVATKRVATFTPIKPKRFHAPSLVTLPLNGLVRPTSSSSTNRVDPK